MNVKRNFSAKREAIYEALASTKSHPTAEWVYNKLKPDIPDLSLGTVYRNLTVFKEVGLAKSVGVVNGQERFDTDMSPHPHFVCTSCCKVMDIPGGKLFFDMNAYDHILKEYGARVKSHSLTFYGICHECAEKRMNDVQRHNISK